MFFQTIYASPVITLSPGSMNFAPNVSKPITNSLQQSKNFKRYVKNTLVVEHDIKYLRFNFYLQDETKNKKIFKQTEIIQTKGIGDPNRLTLDKLNFERSASRNESLYYTDNDTDNELMNLVYSDSDISDEEDVPLIRLAEARKERESQKMQVCNIENVHPSVSKINREFPNIIIPTDALFSNLDCKVKLQSLQQLLFLKSNLSPTTKKEASPKAVMDETTPMINNEQSSEIPLVAVDNIRKSVATPTLPAPNVNNESSLEIPLVTIHTRKSVEDQINLSPNMEHDLVVDVVIPDKENSENNMEVEDISYSNDFNEMSPLYDECCYCKRRFNDSTLLAFHLDNVHLRSKVPVIRLKPVQIDKRVKHRNLNKITLTNDETMATLEYEDFNKIIKLPSAPKNTNSNILSFKTLSNNESDDLLKKLLSDPTTPIGKPVPEKPTVIPPIQIHNTWTSAFNSYNPDLLRQKMLKGSVKIHSVQDVNSPIQTLNGLCQKYLPNSTSSVLPAQGAAITYMVPTPVDFSNEIPQTTNLILPVRNTESQANNFIAPVTYTAPQSTNNYIDGRLTELLLEEPETTNYVPGVSYAPSPITNYIPPVSHTESPKPAPNIPTFTPSFYIERNSKRPATSMSHDNSQQIINDMHDNGTSNKRPKLKDTRPIIRRAKIQALALNNSYKSLFIPEYLVEKIRSKECLESEHNAFYTGIIHKKISHALLTKPKSYTYLEQIAQQRDVPVKYTYKEYLKHSDFEFQQGTPEPAVNLTTGKTFAPGDWNKKKFIEHSNYKHIELKRVGKHSFNCGPFAPVIDFQCSTNNKVAIPRLKTYNQPPNPTIPPPFYIAAPTIPTTLLAPTAPNIQTRLTAESFNELVRNLHESIENIPELSSAIPTSVPTPPVEVENVDLEMQIHANTIISQPLDEPLEMGPTAGQVYIENEIIEIEDDPPIDADLLTLKPKILTKVTDVKKLKQLKVKRTYEPFRAPSSSVNGAPSSSINGAPSSSVNNFGESSLKITSVVSLNEQFNSCETTKTNSPTIITNNLSPKAQNPPKFLKISILSPGKINRKFVS